MPRVKVTLSANAGIVLNVGGTRIWVDALHEEQVPGYSPVRRALFDAMTLHPDFVRPDLIFYTHCHPDHFSRRLTEEMLRRFGGEVPLVLPAQLFARQHLLTAQRHTLQVGPCLMRFVRTVHEGERYREVPHYACVIQCEGANILIGGDTALSSPELAQLAQEFGHFDLAIMDFPWLTLPSARKFLSQTLKPEHLLINHLPFAEDDCYQFRPAARQAAQRYEGPDIRVMFEAFSSELFRLA